MRPAVFFLLVLAPIYIQAQIPTHIPTDREPVNFLESPESIILYIVLPVLIAGFYFLWRHRLKKEQNNKQKDD
jgi:heme/copper-type cytochrome/quinol oxidase subunit 2